MNVSDQEHQNGAPPIIASVGTRVELELLDQSGNVERLTFDIVPESAADLGAGFLGAGTPLAQAIVGEHAGSVVSYTMADIVAVRILTITPSQRKPAPDARTSREAILRKALSRSDLEDALRLALTVDVKWGDYDPEGIEPNWEE